MCQIEMLRKSRPTVCGSYDLCLYTAKGTGSAPVSPAISSRVNAGFRTHPHHLHAVQTLGAPPVSQRATGGSLQVLIPYLPTMVTESIWLNGLEESE